MVDYLKDEGRFLVEFVNGGEELMTYNDLVNAYNARDEEGAQLWTYKEITDHRQTKKREWQVKVLWDTGDETWEPMKVIKEDDKFTLAKYANDNDLTNVPGWKWARRLTKNPKKFIRMAKIFATQAKRHGTKYKHGVKVPKNYNEAVKFDQENGNSLWQDAVKREMGQILDLKPSRHYPREAGHQRGTPMSLYTYALM